MEQTDAYSGAKEQIRATEWTRLCNKTNESDGFPIKAADLKQSRCLYNKLHLRLMWANGQIYIQMGYVKEIGQRIRLASNTNIDIKSNSNPILENPFINQHRTTFVELEMLHHAFCWRNHLARCFVSLPGMTQITILLLYLNTDNNHWDA